MAGTITAVELESRISRGSAISSAKRLAGKKREGKGTAGPHVHIEREEMRGGSGANGEVSQFVHVEVKSPMREHDHDHHAVG